MTSKDDEFGWSVVSRAVLRDDQSPVPIWGADGPIAAVAVAVVYHPDLNPHRVRFELVFLDAAGKWLESLAFDTLEIAIDQAVSIAGVERGGRLLGGLDDRRRRHEERHARFARLACG